MNRLAAPHAWTSDDLRRDASWIQPLPAQAVDGIEAALQHARRSGLGMLQMRPQDFPLGEAALAAIRQAVSATQAAYGLCLLKGLPVHRWSQEDAELVIWGIGLYSGVARTQGKQSNILSHVRDELGEGAYRVRGGRGYNTNAELDFHCDFCDLVGLLCINKAMKGGSSYVVSSMAIHDEIKRRRPDLLEVLLQPFHYSFQGAQAPGDVEWFQCPVFGFRDGVFASRHNRKNVDAAHRDFAEHIGQLDAVQREALDLYEEVVRDPRLCFSMDLEPGDMQLLNNHLTVHSRTAFEDWPEPQRRRHLVRFWLSLPQAQALPAGWLPGYKSVEAGSVRGGLRGSAITQEFLDYEQRQAALCGMTVPAVLRAATA
ncbi:TauD/TfdA family dioxygenase [Ramlibacter sp. G-1-2-2]|uniref:TauD/TfdA family dioxygenase n=1 Tax=Ramlibacter agri TaxID=2728837 RepID=A0A848HDX2_9BURK|nr:TauD/TfdA family dioxygenase [Ramlibacter agri]NML46733.1 TauD/TfdA family dioxygenase [Ramlibacter agri]